ncbi:MULTISPECIES: Lrp/AsnC family transcriptional regulator [Lysinibacillus]|uniref:Lrp/AsnC family transcriptional regulator n=1 Tax=Lysinibacillus antri TaxID=2498145 RepID=A0A3S0RIU3_9BACI|nr:MULTISPECIES: Lrp/AsnC family transcriptional regulator [Lysinibacillus]RUL51758.1 Lrp/AsnC family transcriptional regulator [Lysinibacillus antri]TSI04513.1 Lrp/AsnC family transcriptional regulator [Lysinibacillus sp. BW-2-10]
MDNIDIQLLDILQNDGRITVSELSKALSLSRPSVTERLTRLMEKGVISRISAIVPPPKVGRDLLLFIQVSQVKVPYAEFENMIVDHPDILECHRITGVVDYLLKVAVNDMEHLRRLSDELLKYGNINSSIVLKSPISNKKILPSMEDKNE